MNSIARKEEQKLLHWLFKGKALVVTGARQVGKTTMIRQLFANEPNLIWLNADEVNVRERLEILNINSLASIIGNYKLVVIDEVQRIKNAGLLLKLLVDNFKDVQVIATGSSALDISETIFEPLTGRHLLFHLYPFSLAELYPGKSAFEVEQQLPFHLVFGSYPDVCLNRTDAKTLLKELANQYLYKDILAWKDIRKPDLLDKLLKLLAWQVGSEVSLHELSNQLRVSVETIDRYINLLEKSFVVFRLPGYSTNPRKEVTKMSKIMFWDNGIRNAVLGNFDDLSVRNDQGPLWENFVISERMKRNAWTQSEATSYFWRNYNQSEVDYVEVQQKEISAYEMKWNPSSKSGFSKAFVNAYPLSKTAVINRENFGAFCGL